jgi:hypothetical protein
MLAATKWGSQMKRAVWFIAARPSVVGPTADSISRPDAGHSTTDQYLGAQLRPVQSVVVFMRVGTEQGRPLGRIAR